jgi:hypothetical protein
MRLDRLREAVSAYSMHRHEFAQQHAADLQWAINEIARLERSCAAAIAAERERLKHIVENLGVNIDWLRDDPWIWETKIIEAIDAQATANAPIDNTLDD